MVGDVLPDFDTFGPPDHGFAAETIDWNDGGGDVLGNPFGAREGVAAQLWATLRAPIDGAT